MEPRFNLVHEPWILVRKPDCKVCEVSLKEALINAHEYTGLAGELPTQDAAMMRLLLAVLHTVFSRVDEAGNPASLQDEDDALNRWEALWKLGHFPQKPIEDYLTQWKDRFWLFHEKYPFWQVPEAANGTEYSAAKMNGMLSESNNKVRLFPSRTAGGKSKLSFGEAARWLLYVNAYDDTSAKPKAKGLPSPGAGWLGKIGLIYAKGKSLYETLMLNLVLIKDGEKLWDSNFVPGCKNCPAWERKDPHSAERSEIPLPNHPAQMLTLQSRRLLLRTNGDWVTGYTLLGGDFFPKENALSEQMTIWANRSDEKKGLIIWSPRRHDPSRQLWRDFAAVAVKDQNGRRPGVVSWLARLREEGILSKTELVKFSIAAVKYGDKDFFITDVFSDEMVFHVDLLTKLGVAWNIKIEEEIRNCDTVAFYVASLAESLEKAAGNSDHIAHEDDKAQFYSAIDAPFRQWLSSLSPSQGPKERDQRVIDWQHTAEQIAKRMAYELVDSAGPAAFVGRTLKEKEKNKDVVRHYSAPEAMNQFLYRMKKLYHPEVE